MDRKSLSYHHKDNHKGADASKGACIRIKELKDVPAVFGMCIKVSAVLPVLQPTVDLLSAISQKAFLEHQYKFQGSCVL